jgi:hypothetical protein
MNLDRLLDLPEPFFSSAKVGLIIDDGEDYVR